VEQNRNDLVRRLLFILHRGLVQARNLALCGGNQQIADLADVLETLPGLIANWDDEHLDVVRSMLKTYEDKYPGSAYDYAGYLEKYEPPARF
jgi:hypothetical protein